VEVVPSLQQAVEAGAAPSRRRRSALPRCRHAAFHGTSPLNAETVLSRHLTVKQQCFGSHMPCNLQEASQRGGAGISVAIAAASSR
jgi:hypothetical protein